MPLFDYQVGHCQALITALKNHRVALDASDLGTGKTIVACAVAKSLGFDLVVTGKKIMKPTWGHWMGEWGVSGVVGNWELARRRGLPHRERTLYVFDEVHEGSGYKTLNAKLLINTYEAGLPVLMLSATAIESPMKMWALGYLLGFHNLKDFYRWGFRNGVKRNYGYPGFHFEASPLILERIHKHIFPEYGSRMRRELIPEFPQCQSIVELVAPPAEDKRLERWFKQIDIRETQHELKMDQKALESGMPYANPAFEVLPAQLFARMRAELSKVPVLLEEAIEALAEGFSIVVFVNFLPTLDAFATLCGHKCGLIYGEQPLGDRQKVIDDFQGDKLRLLASTIDSGGAGISLHDITGKFPRLALVCPTWKATTLRQALGRVARAGGKSKAVQKLLFAAGSIEETVAARVREKLDQIDTINDADLEAGEFQAAAL